ncbi:hypothetical protein GGX14DRAFT_653646 [Mycena pura]|uniref:RRM domain-containing protein n=1 Tax=Mycena pura TaxID=153505 RepID=A0AAD6Y8Q2_9AGAR|nr:hypothetical protein GGX14DRAFT_653646 [Mycena pura]
MADYAYAFKAPPHVYQHSYYQPPPTQWDAAQPATNSPPQQQYRPAHTPPQPHAASPAQQPPQQRQQSPPQPQQSPVALLWTSLEPWMDAEYARQVCALLGWDAHVRVPLPDNNSGAAANNMGFAVLTFSSQPAAAAALAQVNAPANSIPSVAGGTASASGAAAPGTKMTMPNSSLPFALAWAPAGLAYVNGGVASSDTDLVSTGNNAGGSNGISSAGTNANGPNSTASANGNGMAAYNGAYPRTGAATGGVTSPSLSPVNVTSMGSGSVTGGGGAPMMTNGNGMGGFGPGIGMGATPFPGPGGAPQYPREYSIFVGDLAPETSNSDLVAVFRNPVLGLRNDRAPKFIRPFTSCKSAKIMLDPVTGVSRGYGFVRFTDEADQQRALIEMHGLYCLSRPMRISPATAKFKSVDAPGLPASTTAPAALGSLPSVTSVPATEARMPTSSTAPSVSALMAGGGTAAYFPPASGTQGVSAPPPPGQEYFAQVAAQQATVAAPQYGADASTTAEWKHHAHARAILGNLMGPNGEQLTSTDPYNTTVFVGGLSPLVGEDTLRTFFVPFGEIHYVKVPVGKHCGFVQFVRKADAERAIEKMQGFPVGGSRIRLSWGRSQYKAAQAAAQAAHSAALQAVQAPPPQPQPQQLAAAPGPQPAVAQGITPQMLAGLTQEQAIMLLQKFGIQGLLPSLGSTSASGGNYADNPSIPGNAIASGSYTAGATGANGGSFVATPSPADAYRSGFHASSSSGSLGEAYIGKQASSSNTGGAPQQPQFTEENLKVRRDEGPFGFQQRAYEVVPPSFSPFSPDPNQQSTQQQQQQQGTGLYAAAELFGKRRDSYSSVLPHPSKAFVPSFFPKPAPVNIVGGGSKSGIGAGSPTRGYGGGGFSGSPPAFQVNRYHVHEHAAPRQPISRPSSGSARGAAVGAGAGERDDWDSMHDVNGTLASLDLSREREPGLVDRTWRLKSPITESASEESTSSGGSVQFRMTMGRTPSP